MSLRKDVVSRLFRKVDRQLNKLDSEAQPRDIHQFRTAARRLESVLHVLVPEPDRKQRKLLKQLSRARRRAGSVRDLDVEIASLRNLKAPEQPRVKGQALAELFEARARRNDKFLKLLDETAIRKLRARMKRMEKAFSPKLDIARLVMQKVSELLDQPTPSSEKLLHQYRIDGKKIRYLAELDPENPRSQLVVAELKRMQDVIGEWHDWLTLNSTLLDLLPETENSPLLSAVRNITKAKYRDAVQAVSTAKSALAVKPDTQVAPVPAKRAAAAAGSPVRAAA